MKMFCFKFKQNHTINEEFDFLMSGKVGGIGVGGMGGEGQRDPYS